MPGAKEEPEDSDVYKFVADNCPDSVFVLDPDDPAAPLRILFANAAALATYGYTAEEMIGRSIVELLDTPESAANAAASAEAILRGEPVIFEATHRRRDGREMLIEVHARLATFRGRRAVLGLSHEISARRKVEALVRQREQRLRAIIGESPACIKLVAPDGTLLEMNEAGLAMIDCDRHEAVEGRLIFELVAEEHRDAYRRFHEAVIEGRRSSLKYDIVGFKGARRTLESIAVPLQQPDGSVLHLGITHDVTEKEHLEGQLRQAQKMEAVGRLSGGIAHDFNNILTVILGNAQLGRDEARAAGSPLGELFDEIEEAAARAAALTRQLLAFSRKQTLALRPMPIDEVITGLDSMLRRLIGEDIALVVELDPDLSPIKADAGQIEQVIVNLAINARAAMTSGGTLTIRAYNVELGPDSADRPADAPPGEYVAVSIRDTGAGMPPEVQARIFEPFFTTRGPGEGTGLGLATVFGIVKQTGGHVAVRSAVGKGSTFHLYFPPTEITRRSAEPPPFAPARAPARARETVLLVEDEGPVRKMARRACESGGYRVIEAPDGAEALRVAAAFAEPIHALITDVVMPRLGGRELAEQLGRLRPGLRVLYMSGYTHDVVIDRGVAHEGLAFLQKPFTQAALLAKLRELLDGDAPPAG